MKMKLSRGGKNQNDIDKVHYQVIQTNEETECHSSYLPQKKDDLGLCDSEGQAQSCSVLVPNPGIVPILEARSTFFWSPKLMPREGSKDGSKEQYEHT